MTVVFLEEVAMSPKASAPVEEAGSRGTNAPNPRLRVVSADTEPASDSASAKVTTAAEASTPADAAERGRLMGRYFGQIDARIERAWLRPRSPVGEGDRFQCRVRLTQDNHGKVLEVELADCNGDSRWQVSLVEAIQNASPLPAPPDPAVFANAVTLAFSADSFGPESNPQNYEPEVKHRLAASSPGPARAVAGPEMSPLPTPSDSVEDDARRLPPLNSPPPSAPSHEFLSVDPSAAPMASAARTISLGLIDSRSALASH